MHDLLKTPNNDTDLMYIILFKAMRQDSRKMVFNLILAPNMNILSVFSHHSRMPEKVFPDSQNYLRKTDE